MENTENVLMELNGFEKAASQEIPKSLEDYLIHVAKSGNTIFPWNKVKPLIKSKLEIIIREFNESCPEGNLPKMPNVDPFRFGEMKERIMEQLESYTGTPFTIQRLCELLIQPKRHYKRTDKFMRGLEKVMLVVSTVDPISSPVQESNGNLMIEREKIKVGACGQVYESPSKRIRLSSNEEEAGPCDSADGSSPISIKALEEKEICPTAGPSNVPGLATSPTPSTASTPSTPAMSIKEDTPESDSMDIDTECTSSQVRMTVRNTDPSSTEMVKEANVAESSQLEGVQSSQREDNNREASPEGDEWVMVEKPIAVCDNGLVSTSAVSNVTHALQEPLELDSSETSNVSDSSDREVGGSLEGPSMSNSSNNPSNELDHEVPSESSNFVEKGNDDCGLDKVETCSSSDQGERMSLDVEDEDLNSEAEPAEEREELAVGDTEVDSPVSVQSSEERGESDSLSGEPRGAADSSDEISAVAIPVAGSNSVEDSMVDEPSCSEVKESSHEVKEGQQIEDGNGNSPDQSDTAQ